MALGSCYSQLGKTEEAIKSFEQGLKLDPTDTSLHLNIAVTLLNIKQNKKIAKIVPKRQAAFFGLSLVKLNNFFIN